MRKRQYLAKVSINILRKFKKRKKERKSIQLTLHGFLFFFAFDGLKEVSEGYFQLKHPKVRHLIKIKNTAA